MSRSQSLTQGEPIARIRVLLANDDKIESVLQAGVHTAEASWDRPGPRPKHSNAPVFASLPTEHGFDTSVYEASFPLKDRGMTGIEIESIGRANLSLNLVTRLCGDK